VYIDVDNMAIRAIVRLFITISESIFPEQLQARGENNSST
jgi:hypothetical protein